MTEYLQRRRATAPRKKLAMRSQSGVVLLVVLVMLVVIGLTSVSVMRGALSADLVSNNERMQTLATQGAQIALRYCESMAMADEAERTKAGFTLQPAPAAGAAAAWQKVENWSNDSVRMRVPDSWQETEKNAVDLPTPECIAERGTMGGTEVVIVTGRGFSPDHTANAISGETESGSAIWLQSILRLAAVTP